MKDFLNPTTRGPYLEPVTLWPEDITFWHTLCDREGIPAGTIKERVKWLMDSHYKLRHEINQLAKGVMDNMEQSK